MTPARTALGKAAARKSGSDRPASAGDEMYFHHNGQPKTGKVVCHGKHGCQAKDCEGNLHKLKWDAIAGHKKRAVTSVKVLEDGEDAAIVENNYGHRQLLRKERAE